MGPRRNVLRRAYAWARPSFTNHAVLVLLTVCANVYLIVQRDFVLGLRDGTIREWNRLSEAMDALWSAMGLKHVAGGTIAVTAAFLVYILIPAARTSIRDLISRKQSVRARRVNEARTFNHQHNREGGSKYSSIYELVLLETLHYVTMPSNLVAIVIILLQGIGSRWKKHRINLSLYIAFYVAALANALISHWQQQRADRKTNHAKFRCATLGTPVDTSALDHRIQAPQEPEPATRSAAEAGLTWVPAESIGLGNLVVVPAGQRVPIDGFVISPPGEPGAHDAAFPFSYTLTGENTVQGPVRPLQLGFHEINSMHVADHGTGRELAPLPPPPPPPPGNIRMARAATSPVVPRSPSLLGPEEDDEAEELNEQQRLLREYTMQHARPELGARPRLTPSRPSLMNQLWRGIRDGGRERPRPRSVSPDIGMRRARSQRHQGPGEPPAPVPINRSRSMVSMQSPRFRSLSQEGAPLRRRVRPAPPEEHEDGGGGGGGGGGGNAAPVEEEPARPARGIPTTEDNETGEGQRDEQQEGDEAESEQGASNLRYFINGLEVPDHFPMVIRGTVHAPRVEGDHEGNVEACRPLLVLAGLPYQYSPSASSTLEPEGSGWEAKVGTVIAFQVFVLMLFSLINWASGQAMREMEVTPASFVSFFLGQFVMGNALIPTKHTELTVAWRQIVKSLFSVVAVKHEEALESILGARTVISDKTGTLTVDSMNYTHLCRYPEFDERHEELEVIRTMGPAWLLLTNDSQANPLNRNEGGGRADERLEASPALCSTPEEGVIYDALVSPPDRDPPMGRPDGQEAWTRVIHHQPVQTPKEALEANEAERLAQAIRGDEGKAAAPAERPHGVPGLMLLDVEPFDGAAGEGLTRRSWRVVIHSCAPFAEQLVARVTVATLWWRKLGAEQAAVDTVVDTPNREVEAAGWRAAGSWVFVQGGGDSVAVRCSREAAQWEQEMLERHPDRTFAHSVGRLEEQLEPRWLPWDTVNQLHQRLWDAGRLHLGYLSKFGNPLVPGVPAMYRALHRKGIRLHICTGDTYLTLRAIMQEMGAIPRPQLAAANPAAVNGDFMPPPQEEVAEVLWDRNGISVRGRDFDFAAVNVSDMLDHLHRVVRETSPNRVVVFCEGWVLEQMAHPDNPDGPPLYHDEMQELLQNRRVTFAWYRTRSRVKPIATRLATRAGMPPPVFIGDGPNDAPALNATPHSVAVAGGSDPAKRSANLWVESAAVLPDVWEMSRVFQGGRAILLRDIVFVGGFVVILNSIGAHLRQFEPMGDKLVVVQDPWSPTVMALYTSLFHTPRVLLMAANEGRRREWNTQSGLLMKTGMETILAIASSLWIGMHIKREHDDLGTYAGFALLSIALITYLRQNLIISSDLRSPPRLGPPRFFVRLREEQRRQRGEVHDGSGVLSRLTGWGEQLLWALSGIPGQGFLVAIFAIAVAPRKVPAWRVLWTVGLAVLVPVIVMLVYRLMTDMSKWFEQVEKDGEGDVETDPFWDDDDDDDDEEEDADHAGDGRMG